jgi:hypothetical protein
MNRSWRCRLRLLGGALLLALGAVPGVGQAQVFLASRPHPEFAIGPLLVVAGVQPDLGPVAVRVSFGLTLPPNARVEDLHQDIYLLWPAEVASASVPGAADPELRRYVEERGFAVVGEGRLALAVRDRTKLGTPAPSDPLPESAPFVTFYKLGTNPVQSGVGSLVKIGWTPRLTDSSSLLSLSTSLKDLITPKAATWLDELFWGRRNVLSLSAGSAGSVALYSILLDQRDRVIRLARDFSILGVEFADSEHLRIEEISPSSATRRPSRVRTGAETVSLALGAGEGLAPQVLTVRFSYFSGLFAWRPIVISLLALVLGNLMGAFMFTRQIARLSRRWFHVERRSRAHPSNGAAVPEGALSRIVPGQTTRDDVIRCCGLPSEERTRLASGGHRTLIYRSSRRVPHPRLRVGWLATVSHWDEEHHEVAIELVDGRVSDVETRVRSSRPSAEPGA